VYRPATVIVLLASVLGIRRVQQQQSFRRISEYPFCTEARITLQPRDSNCPSPWQYRSNICSPGFSQLTTAKRDGRCKRFSNANRCTLHLPKAPRME
jgi:hypothetical protein